MVNSFSTSPTAACKQRPCLPLLGIMLALALAIVGYGWLPEDFSGWSSGFHHPLEGADHLLTMLAVGVWAAQLRGQAIWQLPLAFVGVMSLGGLAGAAGFALPNAEIFILLSCAVFVVLITKKLRFSNKVNVLIVAFFAFFHGFAHGQEISASASLISYTLGFVFATLLLHGLGILVAKLIVLAVACLLTLLFAGTCEAVGKVSGVLGDNALAVTKHPSSIGTFKQWTILQNTERDDYAQNPLTLGVKLSIPDDRWWEVYDKHAEAKQRGAITSNAAWRDLTKKHGSAQVLPASTMPEFVRNTEVTLLLLGFNALYPNINNSPGLSFLSNGVGLTSPPAFTKTLCFSSCPPHQSPVKPHANTLASEEAILQTKTVSQAKTPNFLAVIGHGLCRVQNLAYKINLHANIPSPLTCTVAFSQNPTQTIDPLSRG